MMVQWLARGWELVHSDLGTRSDVFFGYLLPISSLREGLEFDICFVLCNNTNVPDSCNGNDRKVK